MWMVAAVREESQHLICSDESSLIASITTNKVEHFNIQMLCYSRLMNSLEFFMNLFKRFCCDVDHVSHVILLLDPNGSSRRRCGGFHREKLRPQDAPPVSPADKRCVVTESR